MELVVVVLFIFAWLLILIDSGIFLHHEFSLPVVTARRLYLIHTNKSGNEHIWSVQHILFGNILLPTIQVAWLALLLLGLSVPISLLLITQIPILYALSNDWWMHQHLR